MCVVNKQFDLLHFVLNSVYVDLKYNEIDLIFTAGYVCLCGVCSRHWSFCEVVLISYVDAVNVMSVLLFVLHVSMVGRYGGRWWCGCGECRA